MATRIYGISRGEAYTAVTEDVGSAVSADSVEVTFDLASGLSRADVWLALEKIQMHIMSDIFPPA